MGSLLLAALAFGAGFIVALIILAIVARAYQLKNNRDQHND